MIYSLSFPPFLHYTEYTASYKKCSYIYQKQECLECVYLGRYLSSGHGVYGDRQCLHFWTRGKVAYYKVIEGVGKGHNEAAKHAWKYLRHYHLAECLHRAAP